MIKAKIGKGKAVDISIVDDCIEIVNNEKHFSSDISKIKIIPYTDIDGIFIEAYDKDGNFHFRTAVDIIELIARIHDDKKSGNSSE